VFARVQAKRQEFVVALFDHVADEDDELSFEVGDRIQLESTVDGDLDEWWTGSVGERHGMFPAKYVQREEEAQRREGS
jgi:hypothetical protein